LKRPIFIDFGRNARILLGLKHWAQHWQPNDDRSSGGSNAADWDFSKWFSNGMGECWHCVYVNPHSEFKVAERLRADGMGAYVPCYLAKRTHARKTEIIERAFFPRYIFVSADAQSLREVSTAWGVSHVVCNGKDPATVDHSVITRLKSREDIHGHIKLDLQRGDKVRVGATIDGLFDGEENNRTAVLLDLLGRKVRVILDDDDLVTAAASSNGRFSNCGKFRS
jgi:transcriptional antiterminator RfaH